MLGSKKVCGRTFSAFASALTIPFVELRIEWCKARARGCRWSEEVWLLVEEMRRVLGYHLWHADWWEKRAFARTDLSPEETEGAAAYAFRQSRIRIAIHDHCQSSWADVARYVALSEGIERSGLLGFGQVTPDLNDSPSPSPTRAPHAQAPFFTPTRAETAIPTPSPAAILTQRPLSTPARSGPEDTADSSFPTRILAQLPLLTPTRSGGESVARDTSIDNAMDLD